MEQAFAAAYAQKLADWWTPAPGFKIVSHNSAARDGEPLVALILKRRFLPNVVSRFAEAIRSPSTG